MKTRPSSETKGSGLKTEKQNTLGKLESHLNKVIASDDKSEHDRIKNDIFKIKPKTDASSKGSEDEEDFEDEKSQMLIEKGMQGVDLKKLGASTKKKSYTYLVFVLTLCGCNMIWSVVNG